MSSSTLEAPTLYDAIYNWGCDNIAEDGGIPSPETLKQAGQALHAINEFLLEPIAKALKKVTDDALERKEADRVAESERSVTYENIGRLITWTDGLRQDCGYLLDTIAEVTLVAHEDLSAVAEGCWPARVLEDPEWTARMRRFHGLDEPW